MRLLLDTHILIWAMADDPRLPKALAAAIESADNDVAVSAVSIWEITIKSMQGRLGIEIDELMMSISTDAFTEVPVKFGHAARLSLLPPHHRDPFDRMLIAQAVAEGRRLVTTDAKILKYVGVMGFDPLTA